MNLSLFLNKFGALIPLPPEFGDARCTWFGVVALHLIIQCYVRVQVWDQHEATWLWNVHIGLGLQPPTNRKHTSHCLQAHISPIAIDQVVLNRSCCHHRVSDVCAILFCYFGNNHKPTFPVNWSSSTQPRRMAAAVKKNNRCLSVFFCSRETAHPVISHT